MFFCDNVIVNEYENALMIMDFEEAANYYRIFDIGMAIIGICRENKIVNLTKASHLLIGYALEIKLLDIEWNALQAFTVYAAAAMTFWRHSHFNYIQPDPKKANHYLGLKVLADYIRALPGDNFLQKVKPLFH